MRVFVTGATGALGRHLVPGLVASGHAVTATTRTPANAARLRAAGAEPVVLDGLDREAVIAAVAAAEPDVIVHQMTALGGMRSLRNVDARGRVASVFDLDLADGAVQAIRSVVNPDKLGHLGPVSDIARRRAPG